MDQKKTLTADYFKKVYDANDDPWNFESSKYEAEKYEATIAALPKKEYAEALEIGCSIGVLTKLLAKACGSLLATDVSEKALQKARIRCKELKNVTFQRSNFAENLPDDNYDLIMISEVAYYLTSEDWQSSMTILFEKLKPNGNIVLVHWLPEVHDYPQTGDEVHDNFERLMQHDLINVFKNRAENYRIDVWEKAGNG